jgi:hypothetical protein
MILNPLKTQEKNSKKIFLTVYPGTKSHNTGSSGIRGNYAIYLKETRKVEKLKYLGH